MSADRRRAGEGDAADARVAQNFLADRAARTSDDVDGALGECLLLLALAVSRLLNLLDRDQRRERRRARGLDDDRVACSKRRTQLGSHERKREIPRHDARANADRLAHDHAVGVFLRQWHVRAADFGGETGVEFQTVDEMMDFQSRLEKRFSLLLGERLGDVALLLFDQLARVAQHLAAVFRADIGPLLERAFGRLDRLLDVLLVAFGHFVDDFAGGGIPHLVSLTRDRIDQLAAD